MLGYSPERSLSIDDNACHPYHESKETQGEASGPLPKAGALDSAIGSATSCKEVALVSLAKQPDLQLQGTRTADPQHEGDTLRNWQKQDSSASLHDGTAWAFSTELPDYRLQESHSVGPQYEGDLSQSQQSPQVLLDPLKTKNEVDTSGAHRAVIDSQSCAGGTSQTNYSTVSYKRKRTNHEQEPHRKPPAQWILESIAPLHIPVNITEFSLNVQSTANTKLWELHKRSSRPMRLIVTDGDLEGLVSFSIPRVDAFNFARKHELEIHYVRGLMNFNSTEMTSNTQPAGT